MEPSGLLHPRRAWRWPALAGLLILAAAGARLAYLACHCPLDLAPDEAHYWDWSRHLDWSYYSKGPLVAYLVRAGTGLAGAWSERHTGSPALAVRLPAVVCGSLLLASLYVLTVQVFGRPRLAVAVVALALTLPPVAAGSSIMTIDAPYTCCWGWALVFAHRAIFRQARPAASQAMNQKPRSKRNCTPAKAKGPCQRTPAAAPPSPDCLRTWWKPTQSCRAFQTKTGTQHAAASAARAQNPGRRSSRRRVGEVNRNRPSEGSHRAIVYLASTPRPTTSPAAGQAHAERRKTARCPSTSAQPQQQA